VTIHNHTEKAEAYAPAFLYTENRFLYVNPLPHLGSAPQVGRDNSRPFKYFTQTLSIITLPAFN
jgi:hypothetical protein